MENGFMSESIRNMLNDLLNEAEMYKIAERERNEEDDRKNNNVNSADKNESGQGEM